MSCAKTAEPIEMSFGLRTRVDPRNHVLDGGPHHLLEKDNIEGERVADYKVTRLSAVSCAKTAEPIEMPFGLWTLVGSRNHVSDGVRLSRV